MSKRYSKRIVVERLLDRERQGSSFEPETIIHDDPLLFNEAARLFRSSGHSWPKLLTVIGIGSENIPKEANASRKANHAEPQVQIYCFLAERDISTKGCMTIQSPERCFGCPAPTHLCHICRKKAVAFAEVEYCGDCLKKALREEERKTAAKPLCPACGQKQVKYEDYELCLGCTVKEFKPDWDTPKTVTRIRTPSTAKSEKGLEYKKTSSRRAVHSPVRNRTVFKLHRRSGKFFQKELATLMGHKTVCSISRWENGTRKPKLENAMKLAKHMGISVEQLFQDLAVTSSSVEK